MKTDLSQYPRIIMGYHGCDRSVADRVFLQGEDLELSENDYDWLGKGIYFWEYGPQRALEWATASNKIKNPTVVGAVIHLGDCFDLLDRSATDKLEDLYPKFVEALKSSNKKLPKNKKLNTNDPDFLLRDLDCAVVNWSLDIFENLTTPRKYSSVRGLFQEDEPSFPDSYIRKRSHIQVAVRDSACILKYFEPDLKHG